MSYEHLAGRLIETQRSMLGDPAVDIARSTEGITVTDDGTVTGIEGDGRRVVDELAHRYTDVLGGAAESRLLAVAAEFGDELALPPSLGGAEGFADGHRDPATHDPTGQGSVPDAASRPTASDRADEPTASAAGAQSTGAVSDGGTVDVGADGDSSGETRRAVSPTGPDEVTSPTPSGSGDAVSPTPSGPGEGPSSTPGEQEGTSYERAVDDESTDATVEGAPADAADATVEGASTGGADAAREEEAEATDVDSVAPSLSSPVTVRYTVASDLDGLDAPGLALSTVYLLPDDEADWLVPVSVEQAVRDAVDGVADVDPAVLDDAVDAIQTERLVATLRGDAGETVSFQLPGPLSGLTLTFHRSGSLAVH